ncbi:MAG: hypothetical protein FWD17_08220, partial [Polyangiaceae bacterium]|nr:hypothetical protein [Polyangiaceae bacterium]
GSGGAGGTAGISVGIVYGPGSLPAYTTNDTLITLGLAGMAGTGGQPGGGPGNPGNPGASGYVDPNASAATLEAAYTP